MNIAEPLKRVMEEKGISRSRLAREIGVHTSTVSNWLEGKDVKLENLATLCAYFERSMDYFAEDGTGFGGGSAPGAGFGDGTGYGGPIWDTGRKTEKPVPQAGDGLSEEAIKIARLFDSATEELKEAVSGVLEAGATKRRSASIKVTCPIDGTEQVIEQPYLEVGRKKFPDQNNGCEMCHPGEACEKCRLDTMLKVFHLDG